MPIMNDASARARAFRERRKAAGECIAHAGRKPAPNSKTRCQECLERNRETQRRRRGHGPWQPGRPGQPPLELRQEEE